MESLCPSHGKILMWCLLFMLLSGDSQATWDGLGCLELTPRVLFWMRLEAECLLLSVTPWSAVRNTYISSNLIFPIHVELSFSTQTAEWRLVKPAEAGPLQLGKPKCIWTEAHETHKVGTSLCDSREKRWMWDPECIETWKTQLHIYLYLHTLGNKKHEL